MDYHQKVYPGHFKTNSFWSLEWLYRTINTARQNGWSHFYWTIWSYLAFYNLWLSQRGPVLPCPFGHRLSGYTFQSVILARYVKTPKIYPTFSVFVQWLLLKAGTRGGTIRFWTTLFSCCGHRPKISLWRSTRTHRTWPPLVVQYHITYSPLHNSRTCFCTIYPPNSHNCRTFCAIWAKCEKGSRAQAKQVCQASFWF